MERPRQRGAFFMESCQDRRRMKLAIVQFVKIFS